MFKPIGIIIMTNTTLNIASHMCYVSVVSSYTQLIAIIVRGEFKFQTAQSSTF